MLNTWLYYLYGDPKRHKSFVWDNNKIQTEDLNLEKITGSNIILVKVNNFSDIGLKLLAQKMKFESALCVLLYSKNKDILEIKKYVRCEEIEIEDGYVLDFAISSD